MTPAFVLGGGPSLRGFDFSQLDNEITVCANMVAAYLKNPTYFVTTEMSCLGSNKLPTVPATTLRVLVVNNTASKERILKCLIHVDYIIITKQKPSLALRASDGFCHIGNTGFAAIQYAVLLGYNPIFLLGFDLSVTNTVYFYHTTKECYHRSEMLACRDRLNSFRKLLGSLREPTIYSCSPTSALNGTLKYLPFEEALKMSKEYYQETLPRMATVPDIWRLFAGESWEFWYNNPHTFDQEIQRNQLHQMRERHNTQT